MRFFICGHAFFLYALAKKNANLICFYNNNATIINFVQFCIKKCKNRHFCKLTHQSTLIKLWKRYMFDVFWLKNNEIRQFCIKKCKNRDFSKLTHQSTLIKFWRKTSMFYRFCWEKTHISSILHQKTQKSWFLHFDPSKRSDQKFEKSEICWSETAVLTEISRWFWIWWRNWLEFSKICLKSEIVIVQLSFLYAFF